MMGEPTRSDLRFWQTVENTVKDYSRRTIRFLVNRWRGASQMGVSTTQERSKRTTIIRKPIDDARMTTFPFVVPVVLGMSATADQAF